MYFDDSDRIMNKSVYQPKLNRKDKVETGKSKMAFQEETKYITTL